MLGTFLTIRALLKTPAINAHTIPLSSMHVCAFHIPYYIHALSMLMHAHARNQKLKIYSIKKAISAVRKKNKFV